MKAPTQQHRPRLSTPSRSMTKEEFMIEYVFRRAVTQGGSLDAEAAARSAAEAWELIQRRKNY